MGLTLHFSATLRDPSLHAPLTAEVADICRSMDWPYQLFNDTCDAPADAFPLEPGTVQNGQKTLHLNGLLFTPPECETVALIFTQSGRSCPPWHVDMAESLAQIRPDMVYNLHVKTQFAGPDTHVALVSLLQYLSRRYFAHIEVVDEGHYWETLDRAVLDQRFREYWGLFDAVEAALKGEDWKDAETPGEIADRMEEIIRRKFGKEGNLS